MALIPKNCYLNYKLLHILFQQVSNTFICGLFLLSGLLPQVAMASMTSQTCSNTTKLDENFSHVTETYAAMSTWLTQPTFALQSLIETVGPYVSTYLNRSSWPQINEQAKLARVPIMMYHDILPEKKVFFDVTPTELEQHLELIKANGLTPISIDQLMLHLQTGMPLPDKPILLSFDDGYEGHYQYAYPLLKKYGYPAVFAIYTKGIGQNTGRSHVTWQQLHEMAADPLITIASHSVTHPTDLSKLPDVQLQAEIFQSKILLESNLRIPIRYFVYPSGKYDGRVGSLVTAAGYQMALTMSDSDERFAGSSESLLAVSRFGQSRLKDVIEKAWGGPKLSPWKFGFDFTSPVQLTETSIDKISLLLASGGKPITIHTDAHYSLEKILTQSSPDVTAIINGGFFSLKSLSSNVMIGPVYSQTTKQFFPGNNGDIYKIAGRPLVLISPYSVRFIPFDPLKHNTLAGIQAEMPNVTDAFVAAAWLVKDGQPQSASTFNNLYGFNVPRYRAFWGINQAGQATLGISRDNADAVSLGAALTKAGFQDAVMVDSGQSTSLIYKGQSFVKYEPRPVPHAIALVGMPSSTNNDCILVENKTRNQKS